MVITLLSTRDMPVEILRLIHLVVREKLADWVLKQREFTFLLFILIPITQDTFGVVARPLRFQSNALSQVLINLVALISVPVLPP